MYIVNFPQITKVKITQDNKREISGVVGIARVFNFVFGQGHIEDLLSPVLEKLGIDKQEFFFYFWKHIEEKSK